MTWLEVLTGQGDGAQKQQKTELIVTHDASVQASVESVFRFLTRTFIANQTHVLKFQPWLQSSYKRCDRIKLIEFDIDFPADSTNSCKH